MLGGITLWIALDLALGFGWLRRSRSGFDTNRLCPDTLLGWVFLAISGGVAASPNVTIVNVRSLSDVEDIDDETREFKAAKHSKSRGAVGNKSLYGRWKDTLDDDPYDDEYNAYDLTEEQMAFCDAWDIKLRDRRK
ncbi:hypothetical protein Tco_1524962 [Tanacetum coccineum]